MRFQKIYFCIKFFESITLIKLIEHTRPQLDFFEGFLINFFFEKKILFWANEGMHLIALRPGCGMRKLKEKQKGIPI